MVIYTKQKRKYQVSTFVEEDLKNKIVEASNKDDRTISTYLRNLIKKDVEVTTD